MNTPEPDTLANSSSNNSNPGRSPRPDRDAFLRRLEERQRQRQIAQQEDNDEGIGGGGTPKVPGGGDGTAAAAREGADGKGSDQKRPAPSTPAGAAAVAVAASTPTSAGRKSGIPPPRASSARKGPEEDGTEKKMATETGKASEAATAAANLTTEITSAIQKESSVEDRNEAKAVQQPIETDADADASTPIILSYLSECGISPTADLGIFVPAHTATGPAGPQFTQRLEDAFDPASLQALLDMSRKRKGDHVVVAGGEGSGDGKENSLSDAHTFMKRVKELFAEQPSVYDEFVALMLDLENDKINLHTAASKVVTLFRGHDDLIMSFNEHLPQGCRIELTGTDLNDGDRSGAGAAGAAAAASRDLLAEMSFEEERWEHYKRARSSATNAAVNAFANEASQQGRPSSVVGAGDDDTSTVPPLREIRGGTPSASAPTVTGANATTPSYSRRISDLTMPPSLATSGIRTGANSVSNDDGADTVRTDATVAGEVGGASAAAEEQEEEIDLSTLEPWQRALFRRIDEQTRLVRQIEGKVDALAETIRIQQQQQMFGNQHPPFQQPEAAIPTRMMEIPQNRDEAVRMLRNIPPPPGGNAPEQLLPNQPPQQQQQFFFLSLLELLVEGLINILTAPYAVGLHITSVLITLRPVRLLRHLYREADRRGVLRRFDLSLLFKFVFVSAILAGRTGGAGRRRGGNRAGGGAELLTLAELWDRHRLSILIGGTVLALLCQTGFVNLVWDVIVKEDAIGMIWRDEDMRNEEGAGPVEAADAADNNDNDAARGGADVAADAAEGNGARINQDANQANNAANGGGGNAGAAAGAARQPARRAPRPRPAPPQQPGFFGGGIEPVPANGGFSALGFVVDIIYIIGSLFLSLLPAWHPEPIRRPPPEPQQRANAAGDGDANIDGGGGGGGGGDAMNADDNEDPVQGNE